MILNLIMLPVDRQFAGRAAFRSVTSRAINGLGAAEL
jgi:hypothetical protein